MTTFLLVRHAERDTPDDLLPGRAAGVALTGAGRAQAERIAAALHSEPVDQVLSSPLERAVETARPLARAKGLDVVTVPAFNEIEFGAWTGRRFGDLEPEPRWRGFNAFRSGTRIPGGECAAEVQVRMVAELIRLRDAFPGQTIACFSHADPIRLVLGYFLGAPIDFFHRLEISPGAISRVVLGGDNVRVLCLNELP